jgi:hypothetical protein
MSPLDRLVVEALSDDKIFERLTRYIEPHNSNDIAIDAISKGHDDFIILLCDYEKLSIDTKIRCLSRTKNVRTRMYLLKEIFSSLLDRDDICESLSGEIDKVVDILISIPTEIVGEVTLSEALSSIDMDM